MKPKQWPVELGKGIGILELGATREEVLRRLAEADIKVEDGEDDPSELYIDEIDTALKFTEASPPVLWEIAMSDDGVRLGPLEIIDKPLLEVVDLLRVPDSETRWTCDSDDEGKPIESPSGDSVTASPPSDKTLLSDGMLWLVPLGVGLEAAYGEIWSVHLRQPTDVPKVGWGPLTAAQRELAARPDLTSHLLGPVKSDSSGLARFQRLIYLALFASMGFVVWKGYDYQTRLNATPIVLGTVTDVAPPPPDPFPSAYTVVYQDHDGNKRTAAFNRNAVYETPKIGDTIPIRFLPESPDEPLGPAQVNDAGMFRYSPWALGVLATFCVVLFLAPIADWLLRQRED